MNTTEGAGGFFSEKKEDGMKVCRGPFNVSCTTNKEPALLLFDMVKALEGQKVSYKKVSLSLSSKSMV